MRLSAIGASDRRRDRPWARPSARPASRPCGRPSRLLRRARGARRSRRCRRPRARSRALGAAPALLEVDARVAWRSGSSDVPWRRRPVPTVRPSQLRLGERVVAFLEAARVIADRAPRRRRRRCDSRTVSTPGTPRAIVTACVRLVLGVHPARELDRRLADRADVDRALGTGSDRCGTLRARALRVLRSALLHPPARRRRPRRTRRSRRRPRARRAAASSSRRAAAAQLDRLHSPLKPPTRCATNMPTAKPATAPSKHARDRARERRLVVILENADMT